MLEGEFNKIAGMRLMLEQQKEQVDAAGNDIDIFKALKEGNEFIKENIKSVNIDSLEDLKDQLEDQQEEKNKIDDFFLNVAKEGDDEIIEELEKLEVDNVTDELKKDEVPNSGNLLCYISAWERKVNCIEYDLTTKRGQ